MALLAHGEAISKGVVKIGTTRVPWLFGKVGMPKAAGRIEKATRFVVDLPQRVAESKMRIWKPRSIKDGLAEWFSTQGAWKGQRRAAARRNHTRPCSATRHRANAAPNAASSGHSTHTGASAAAHRRYSADPETASRTRRDSAARQAAACE